MSDRVMVMTGPGVAGIAVVRLAGEGVSGFLRKHFGREARDGRTVYGEVRDGETIIDDALVAVSDEGRVADLNVHGGVWVVHSVVELARKAGFTPVEDTTSDEGVAMMDGATVLEREVAAWLPLARTELASRALLRQPALWNQWVSRARAGDITRLDGDWALYRLLHPPRVAIVGVPNVGKSTLANRLFAQERSITADLPGTTRDWVGEIANLDGLAVTLVDTPGLRETDDAIERLAIERSGRQVSEADLLVVVLDPTQEEPSQRELLTRHPGALVVVNKSDKARGWTSGLNAPTTVATTGEGIAALRETIRSRFGVRPDVTDRPLWWTARQKRLIDHAQSDLTVLSRIVADP